jgi:putative transposase
VEIVSKANPSIYAIRGRAPALYLPGPYRSCICGGLKEVATDLKAIYSAATEAEAEFNLEHFAEKWDQLYPTISKAWRVHWTRVIPLFAFPEGICKVIYTTNATRSVNLTLRKVTRNHRIFPSDEAVYKVVYLAMRNLAKKWSMPIRDWEPALNRFAIECEGRFPR